MDGRWWRHWAANQHTGMNHLVSQPRIEPRIIHPVHKWILSSGFQKSITLVGPTTPPVVERRKSNSNCVVLVENDE